MPSDPFETLSELARVVPSQQWMLVGGLMVHCHAQRVGVAHARPTRDADVVVEVHAVSYGRVAKSLNRIVDVIAERQDAWQMCPPTDWGRAIRAARIIKSDWRPPEFIRPRRPR